MADQLSQILDLDRQTLVARWRDLVGSSPPSHASMTLLRSAVAYELQTKALGNVPKRTERVLAVALRSVREGGPTRAAGAAASAIAPAHSAVAATDQRHEVNASGRASARSAGSSYSQQASSAPPRLTPSLAPGTQLVREWNGRTWRVEVVKGGFICKGKRYRSLSAIAKMITGAHWSGPRFFGLRS